MNTQASYPNAAYYRWLLEAGILLLLLSLSSVCSARPLTATITDLKGQVRLYGRIGSPVIGSTVKVGEALKADDTIQTQDGAAATLTLSDGSMLQLGENTRFNIVALVLEPATGARQSQLKLLEGRMRATLSPGHQKKGSSFTVETPNALAEVTFSRPVIEVSYDPKTKTSVFKAYTVVLNITNRLTRETRQVPRGSQAIIWKKSILLSPISEKVTPIRNNLERQLRNVVRGATSTAVPISIGVVGVSYTELSEGATITVMERGQVLFSGRIPELSSRIRFCPITIRVREQ